jgi:hypothetical protein
MKNNYNYYHYKSIMKKSHTSPKICEISGEVVKCPFCPKTSLVM